MIKRYFVDVRVGCVAIRDRFHPDYDEDYQGLNPDLKDVVKFHDGEKDGGDWYVSNDAIKNIKELCEKMNNDNNSVK